MAIIVSTPADLEAIKDNLSGNYIQANDIDLSGHLPEDPLRTWNPIDDFTGTYDGNCYNLTGIQLNRLGNVGFFGNPSGATIKNVRATINSLGGTQVGSLIGVISNGTVENCRVGGTVEGQRYVGGFVGAAQSTSFYDCITSASVTANYLADDWVTTEYAASYEHGILIPIPCSSSYGGGFVGALTTGNTLEYCAASGSVIVGNDSEETEGYFGIFAGGFAIILDSGNTLRYCQAENDTRGSFDVGGFLGLSPTSSIENCQSVGPVTMHTSKETIIVYYEENYHTILRCLGGFIGLVQEPEITLNDCYCSGEVDIASDDTYLGQVGPWDRGWKQSGAFAGYGPTDVTVSNNYYEENATIHTDDYLADPTTATYTPIEWPPNACDAAPSQIWVKKGNLWLEVKRH